VTNRQYFPALRGRFGDWAYYSLLMTLGQVAQTVKYASEVHLVPSESKLSKLIQRELNTGRSVEIGNYLKKNEDRFFNSLVLAVYGGDPAWHEFDVKPRTAQVRIDDLSDTALYSIGYLSLTGEEALFALDGQHRVAGIRAAVDSKTELAGEELSVLIVAHHNTVSGLRRTRKLFTTLNRTAKPVKKSEIIALDESDVMAIATRHLVENHPFFNRGQIDVLKKQANLHPNNFEVFTTIINMYDTLQILFSYVKDRLDLERREELKFYRPSDAAVTEYNKFAAAYYERLAKSFPELSEYFRARRPERILKKYRGGTYSHILFRPIGHIIFAEVLKALRATMSFNAAFRLLTRLPTRMQDPPYAGVIWNPRTKTIRNSRASLCRDILLFMLRHGGEREQLLRRYADALDRDVEAVRLPKPVV
jgi:DNA sulfur modification protein DndB